MDYGLIGGIAKGLDSGLKAYQDAVARREKREADAEARKFQQEQFNAELQMKGYQKDPETGKYLRTDEYKQEKDQEYQQKLGLIDRKGQVESGLLSKKKSLVGDGDGLLGPGGKAPTTEQSKAGGFAQRVRDAEAVFERLAESGEGGENPKTAFQKTIAAIPVIGSAAKLGGFVGEGAQLSDQAERNFINATLRRESGASISPSEFKNAEEQYLPKAGDSKEKLAQKRENRLAILAQLETEAGPRLVEAISQRKKQLVGAGGRQPQVQQQKNNGFSQEDILALRWAEKNPKDARAAEIRKRLGL